MKVLYATGLIENGTLNINPEQFEGTTVTVVQSLEEAFQELDDNASEYSFALICVKSFYAAGNKNDDEIFSDLQLYVTQNKHIQFAIIDVNKLYQPRFNMALSPLKNVKYTSASKLTIRTFSTLLSTFLQGSAAKPKAPPVEPATVMPEKSKREMDNPKVAPVVPPKTEVKPEAPQAPAKPKGLFGAFGKKKLEAMPPAKPVTEFPQEPEQAVEITLETKVPTQAPKAQPKQQSKPQPQTQLQAKKKKKPVFKHPLHALEGKTLLFTQASTCGATTVALMTARQIAKSGLTVCYVEVPSEYASSHAIIDEMYYPVSGYNLNNNLDSFCMGLVEDVSTCFEMCEEVHILRNDAEHLTRTTDLKQLNKQLPRMFDVVVYDIAMSALRMNPLFLLTCSYKYLVLTNDYTDIAKVAMELTRQRDGHYNQENVDILCDAICKEFRVVISRYSPCDGKSRRKKEWRDVQSEVVDINESLRDIEAKDVSAVIPESISVNSALFAAESVKHVTQLLEELI